VFGIDEFGIIKENEAPLATRSKTCLFGNHGEEGGHHLGGDRIHDARGHGGTKREGHALVEVESNKARQYPPFDNKLGTKNAFRTLCRSLVIYNQQLGSDF
jgi:hypothetical protein